ncbi:PAS domain-containing protein [Elioraea sp.]|uniref:PAS domain-containing protein n=1 Tax=Elioraea sp. TaxID=2185103 RepID=UPI0025BBCC30|nr:PAS domain-containing protein [Elioraea sp.]
MTMAARTRLNRASRSRVTFPGFTTLLPILAIAVPAFVLLLAAKQSWDGVVEDATVELSRLADAGAETAERALGGYSVTAARINDRLLDLAAEAPPDFRRSAHELLAELVSELNPPVIAFAIDGQGRPLAASHLFPVPADHDLSDRDFFQALRRDDAPAVHVSRMFTGRFDGQLLVAVSRARRSRGETAGRGRFEGLTTISFDPNGMGASLRRLLPSAADSLALVHDDGAPIASTMVHALPLSPPQHDGAFDALLRSGARSGHYRTGKGAGGPDRLVAVRSLQVFPLHAVATRPLESMRARWRAVFLPYLGFGLPAIAALLTLSLRVRADQVRLVAANATLARDVARSEDRLERAKRYALVGTFEVDLTNGSSVRSPEYMAVHGLAPQDARETHADWLRRLHPDDRTTAEAHLLRTITDHNPSTDYAQTYRTVTPSGDVRWISARGEIERDAAGRAVTLRGIHVDVTSLRSTEVALAGTNARLLLAQDAVGIGAWDWSPATGTFYLAPRTHQLLGLAPSQVVRSWRCVVRRILPEDRALLWQGLRDAAATQSMRVELRIMTPSADGAPARQPWVMIRARAVDLGDGSGMRLIGVAYDITERKEAEARATLLAHEVEHRARNAMTLVSGLVRMTTAGSHDEFVEILEGRIKSLARAITLLGRSRWSGAAIDDLAREELAPFLTSPGVSRDIRIEGPRAMVDADTAQQLSMALHELTTNSVKYGALSVPQGTISITWAIHRQRVTLTWKERGGPIVRVPPTREGFGTLLVRSTFEQQLGGSVAMEWEEDGLRCSVTFPLRPP